MCGILGFTYKDVEKLKKGLEKIKHRGPDSTGIYYDDNISLGHNRLSIIDLSSSADQPMNSIDRQTIIAFNGEIYNYRELKNELIKSGSKFNTTSDTEVILNGYEREGIKFFYKMRGMWAFVIYDKKNNKVILSRDCFGIKPLYYAVQNNKLYFFSEIKSIRNFLKLTPNTDFYFQYFNLGFFIAPNTCYKEIKKLDCGEILIWDLNKKDFISKNFIPLNNIKKNETTSEKEAINITNEALIDSINQHFIADVPVGVLFSGGNDSSLIASIAASLKKDPTLYHLKIKGSSDTYYAEKISKHLGLKINSFEMTEEMLYNQYYKIWDILDEPTGDISIIPTSLIYSLIENKTKVVLSGEGGDEFFGGYKRHEKLINNSLIAKDSALINLFNSLSKGQSAPSLNYINPAINKTRNFVLDNYKNDLIGSYLKGLRIIDYPLYYNEIREYIYNFYKNKKNSVIPANLFFDIFLYLPNDLMYKNDISSMAYSIEARTPFLDKIFFEKITRNINSKFLFSKEYNQKRILKKVMEKYLPKELIYRDKKGFGFSFKIYNNKDFVNDYKKAAQFHCKNSDSFFINSDYNDIKRLLNLKNNIIVEKYPRFAFSLVSNWNIFKNI